ncbi:poly(A) polymerase, putative [Cordyceps militaris CM01]|uniref:Poly(A) polymerase, putative n=1 Tax=Cordyceps militaris (strain CM01) TaxID=983644 RepID=G3JMK3_CORMM|nr:poly(A) polymerase, putative [Cordyceps militaris CM01]EGX90039.1 poly(A) polymerase, putative [Cordyceps militaris CM01]
MAFQLQIQLQPAEQLLREFLLEAAQHFPGLEIWITGGWVRDRLLGIPSSDLDLALSNLTGKEFGTFLQTFSATPEIEAKYTQKAAKLGLSRPCFSRFHITKKNAKTCKKLETAGGVLFGLDVDLVNLRKEVYDGQSRNPEMEFGTAAEDASRRDATANALFFHLERKEVVDFTGRGLQDLQAKIMRTPLDPKQTLLDDPLRVLRLIRVAGKLGFSVAPETALCMQDPEVHGALDAMITRDRIGAELVKMMTNENSEASLKLLFECRLYSPVFVRLDSALLQLLAAQCSSWGIRSASSAWPTPLPRAYRTLARLLDGGGSLSSLIIPDDNRHLLWILAAYSPFARLRHTLRQEIVREAASSIRAPARAVKLLDESLRNFDSIRNTVNRLHRSRGECGMAIRSWGPAWTAQLAFVMLAEALDEDATDDDAARGCSENLWEKFSRFAVYISQEKLERASLERPLLNGREIQELFGLEEGGKYLKGILDELIQWQFNHPSAAKDDCQNWLSQKKDDLLTPTSR